MKRLYQLGDRVTVLRPIDLGGGVKIAAGSCGIVDHIDGDTAEILMDKYHRCLSLWDNHFWTDEYINGHLAITGYQLLQRRNVC